MVVVFYCRYIPEVRYISCVKCGIAVMSPLARCLVNMVDTCDLRESDNRMLSQAKFAKREMCLIDTNAGNLDKKDVRREKLDLVLAAEDKFSVLPVLK